jgi:hypothetical protein
MQVSANAVGSHSHLNTSKSCALKKWRAQTDVAFTKQRVNLGAINHHATLARANESAKKYDVCGKS